MQSEQDLRPLVKDRVPETDVLEFKRQIDGGAKVGRPLAAMANGRGGTVLFGVVEQNSRAAELKPVSLAEAAEQLPNMARDVVDEPLLLEEVLPIYTADDRGVLVVRVAPSVRAPHFVGGCALIRSGPTSRPMTAHEVGVAFARRGRAFIEEFRRPRHRGDLPARRLVGRRAARAA